MTSDHITKNNTEEKSSWLLWGGGLIFGSVGFFFLLYSGYIFLSVSPRQKIAEILPLQDIQGIVFHTEEEGESDSSHFVSVQKTFPLLPKNGAMVIYPHNEIVRIEEHNKDIPLPVDLYCEEQVHYVFCTHKQYSSRVIALVDSIKKKEAVLSSDPSFSEAITFADQNKHEFFWYGTSVLVRDIVLKNIDPFFDKKTNTVLKESLFLLSRNASSLSGTIDGEKMMLRIPHSSPSRFFKINRPPRLLSEILSPTADRYLFLQNPKSLWDGFLSSFEEEHYAVDLLTKKMAEKSFTSFFSSMSPFLENKKSLLSFSRDIYPLFAGNVMWEEGVSGRGVVYSLSENTVSHAVFIAFTRELETVAQWMSPQQVNHTLEDGTVISEVFPNDKIFLKKEREEGQKKNSVFFRDLKHNVFLGVVSSDYQLILTDSDTFFDDWKKEIIDSSSHHLFSDTQSSFLSLGFQKRKEEISPFSFLDIHGVENESAFVFSGTVIWNDDFEEEKEKARKDEERMFRENEEKKQKQKNESKQ